MPTGRRSSSSSMAPAADSGTGVAAPGPPLEPFSARGRGDSRTTVSTSVFQSPQVRHWPSQRTTAAPQDWQT